jgi:diguanylate cyclase (GGDEF)-like protein/putative nucleotidyltransferase with HDIG domain
MKTRIFIVMLTGLGLAQITAAGFVGQPLVDPPFFIYISLAIAASLLQAKQIGWNKGFSLSLPVVLLSIVELSVPQAVVIGSAAALVLALHSPEARSNVSRIVAGVGVHAAVIASSVFVVDALLPRSFDQISLRVLAGVGALFVANTLPVAFIARLSGGERLGKVWREAFWSFPYYLVSGALAMVIHGGAGQISLQTSLLLAPSLFLGYRYYRTQKEELETQQRHAGQMAALHLRSIEGLALAVEAKDTLTTRGHLRRVQAYSLGIGKEMGLQGDALDALHAGALLHDIGKLAVPESILTKPGKLTAEEFATMKVHPLVGAEIVEQVQFPYPVAPIVRAHHEKWDGSGYPMGLRGEEIPLGARILSVVDTMDALTSDREYRKGVPAEEAMAYIEEHAGTSFDPAVVTVLKRVYHALDTQLAADPDLTKVLSKGVVIERGSAPAAGLEFCTGAHSHLNAGDVFSTIASVGREEALLRELANSVGELDLHQLFPRLNDVVRRIVPCHSLAFFGKRSNMLFVEFAAGGNQRGLQQLEVPVGEGLTGLVAEHQQAVVNGNPEVDRGYWNASPESLGSTLSVPLTASSGLIGVLNLYRGGKDAFSRDDLRLINQVAPHVALAMQNGLRYREVQLQAKLDPVTGLPNEVGLVEFLDQELIRGRRLEQGVGVLVLEMKHYEGVREKLGPSQADRLLDALASDLKRTCREYDQVARVGAATFALGFPGMTPESLAAKLSRLKTFLPNGRSTFGELLEVDFGGAIYPQDGEGGLHLLNLARHRITAPGANWAESLLQLADSVGASTPVGTPQTREKTLQ